MTDLALIHDPNNYSPLFDLSILGGEIVTDNGLYTAVVLSLFLDKRASPDEVEDDDLRGWWGNQFNDDDDEYGSFLWLLKREKQKEEVAGLAEDYALDALAWMVEDGIVSNAVVVTEWVERGVLGMVVKLKKPNGDEISFRFNNLWNEVLNAG